MTLVNGIAGPRVRSVAVRADGHWRELPLGPHRGFVWAARGVKGPSELPVRVTYVDGRVVQR